MRRGILEHGVEELMRREREFDDVCEPSSVTPTVNYPHPTHSLRPFVEERLDDPI